MNFLIRQIFVTCLVANKYTAIFLFCLSRPGKVEGFILYLKIGNEICS